MAQRTLCRLCTSTCSKFRCLFDDSGQLNGVYEIAVKYFDPMILTPVNGDKTDVICIKCWHHIRDFYSFQQTVIQNQSQLKTSKLVVRLEKLPVPVVQTPPIKDEISAIENSISVFDIVQIQNVATAEATATLNTNYDMVIKEQSIVLQISPNIEPITSLDKVCEQHLQEATKINGATDECLEKLNCDICGNIFPNNYLLLEHYRDHHNNNDNIEIDQTELNSFVQITDDDADNNLLNTNKMESNSYVEISDYDDDDDDDQNDKTIEIDNEFTDVNAYILQQRSLNNSNPNLTKRNKLKPLSFSQTRLIYDEFIAQWNRDLECPLCKSRFTKYSKYSKHFKNDHSSEKCFIICCQSKFFFRNQLVEHISLHLNPNIFKCYICGSKLTRKGSLKRHFQFRHKDELTPEEIEQIFQDKSIYKTQCELINGAKVQILNNIHNRNDISFEQQSLLLAEVPGTTVSSLQNVPCPTPPRFVNLAPAVSTKCFFPRGQQQVAKTQLLQQKRKFKCPLCYIFFTYKGNLNRHMKIHKNQILTEGEHNIYLGSDPISSNSSIGQLSVSSNPSYPLARDTNNFVLDQSNTISSIGNEIKSKNDEKVITTSIVSTNDIQIHEIISETPNNDGNTTNNGDIVCYNEIRMPAVDIVDVKDEIPLNSHNEFASNNLIINN